MYNNVVTMSTRGSSREPSHTSLYNVQICDMGTAKKLKATVKQTFTGTIAWIAPEVHCFIMDCD